MARDFKTTRSAGYQNVIMESAYSPEKIAEFSDAQGFTGKLNDLNAAEERHELKDQLKTAFWRVVDTELTPRQREVLHLYKDGKTQIEIAKILNVNQSSITKSINGNCDYKNGKRVYGGAKKKLKRIVDQDKEIQSILSQIADLDENY